MKARLTHISFEPACHKNSPKKQVHVVRVKYRPCSRTQLKGHWSGSNRSNPEKQVSFTWSMHVEGYNGKSESIWPSHLLGRCFMSNPKRPKYICVCNLAYGVALVENLGAHECSKYHRTAVSELGELRGRLNAESNSFPRLFPLLNAESHDRVTYSIHIFNSKLATLTFGLDC